MKIIIKTTKHNEKRTTNKKFMNKQKPTAPKEENKQNISDIIARCKAIAKSPQNNAQKPTFNTFKVGTRVFHPHFGIGNILEVEGEGLSATYKVDFAKNGVKSVDGSIGNLKAF